MGYKKSKGEVYPLLTTDWLGTPTYRQRPAARHIRYDEEEPEPVFEDDDEVFDIVDQKKKRSVNLVWIDVLLIVLDFLQILAVIQSMSLRWVWPEKWLRGTYFIFGFNVDVWEINKFTNTSTYKSIQEYFTPSNTVNISYKTLCYAWFGSVIFLFLLYAVLHAVMKFKFYPNPWARRLMSRIQFIFMLIVHIFSLPFGTVLFRIFECETLWNKVYTLNEYSCFSTDHWQLAAPAVVFIVLLFLVYPGFLVWKIRQEGMIGSSDGYLSYVLLKETEYKIHLNWAWLYDGMWVFSSFKYRGLFYRPTMQVVKLVLLVIYTSAFTNIKTQAMVTTIFLLLAFLAVVVIRPYRLTSCNIFLMYSILCNLGNAFIGTLLASYNPYTTPSAWLTKDYIIWFIVFVQASWALAFLVLLVYLISRTLCHSTKSCYRRPVWPNIASSGLGHLTPETRKFMIAIIKAKIVHEKILRVPALFAPIHDLARHIKIINTYCREAEYIQDALHMVLWEVLDELVDTHAELSPKSLFAESVKKSIRRTAAEFMSLVPMFSQRLAQRDYEFILVPPHKKRLLLKMYILGIFLNGRSEKVAKKKLFEPAVEKVWQSLPADREFEEEDGYYEDLYPGQLDNNYSDDLLNVIVDNSTDAESTEEEDNVQGMLRNLPEVGLIDLETPEIFGEDEVQPEDTHQSRTSLMTPPHQRQGPTIGHVTSSDKNTLRPATASNHKPSAGSSLFGSQALLRPDAGALSPAQARPSSASSSGSIISGGQHLSSWRPESAGSIHSGRNLSPSRPSSAGSSHSGRDNSPTGQRPTSGSSVISSQPSRPGSAGSVLSQHLMATINPGYIPDDEEMENGQGEQLQGDKEIGEGEQLKGDNESGQGEQHQGDNPAFVPDENPVAQAGDQDETISMVTEKSGSRSGSVKHKKKRRKSKQQ